jgi:hypothetical protein
MQLLTEIKMAALGSHFYFTPSATNYSYPKRITPLTQSTLIVSFAA